MSLDANKDQYHHFFVRSEAWYELNNRIFIIMDFMPLGNLQRNLHDEPLPDFEGRQITEQVLEAVWCMHESGFLHYDLKPSVCIYGEILAIFLAGI